MAFGETSTSTCARAVMRDKLTAFGWGTGWRNLFHIFSRVRYRSPDRYGICFAKPLHLYRLSPESLPDGMRPTDTRWAMSKSYLQMCPHRSPKRGRELFVAGWQSVMAPSPFRRGGRGQAPNRKMYRSIHQETKEQPRCTLVAWWQLRKRRTGKGRKKCGAPAATSRAVYSKR